MKLRLLAVGTRMPAWVTAAFDDYARRLPRELSLQLTEIPVAPRASRADVARLRRAEGEKMLRSIGDGAV